jgi:hypothetical protein
MGFSPAIKMICSSLKLPQIVDNQVMNARLKDEFQKNHDVLALGIKNNHKNTNQLLF